MPTSPDFQRIVDDPRYTVQELTLAIENVPNYYNMLQMLGLFRSVSHDKTFIEIEIEDGELNLIPTNERGAPAPRGIRTPRHKRLLPLQYQNFQDRLGAEELQNLPAFGTSEFFESFDRLWMKKVANVLKKYRQTHEYWRWGALKGNVYDADGVRVLYNCYDEMGETQQTFEFGPQTGVSDTFGRAARDIRRYNEEQAKGEMILGTLILCSKEFFENLLENDELRKAYRENPLRSPNPLFEDVFAGFTHMNVTYVEHNGVATYSNPMGLAPDVTHRFIPAGEAISVPILAPDNDVFYMPYGPGTTLDTVNRPGQEVNMKMRVEEFDRGIEMYTESSPLALVTKPRLVGRCVYTPAAEV